MKHAVWILLLLALATPVARADESARLTKLYDWFLGEWTVTVDGEAATGTLSVKHGAGGRCHVTPFSLGNVSSQGLFGWDPDTKRWTGTWFGSDGSHGRNVLDEFKGDRIQKGDSWRSSEKMVAVDETKGSSINLWRIVDENTFTHQETQRKLGDKQLPDVTYRYTRKMKK